MKTLSKIHCWLSCYWKCIVSTLFHFPLTKYLDPTTRCTQCKMLLEFNKRCGVRLWLIDLSKKGIVNHLSANKLSVNHSVPMKYHRFGIVILLFAYIT